MCFSQVRTVSAAHKKVQAIWDMPNHSLIPWVPKTGKTKKSSDIQKSKDQLKFFPYKTSRDRKAKAYFT